MRLTILNSLQFLKSNQIKSNVGFAERGKLEYPVKNLSEQSREPTNSAHMTPGLGIEPGDTLVEGECSHHCANPVPLASTHIRVGWRLGDGLTMHLSPRASVGSQRPYVSLGMERNTREENIILIFFFSQRHRESETRVYS